MARVVVVGSNTRKRRMLQIAVTVFIIALTVFMLTPFVWMISSSFKREEDVMAQPFQLVPSYTYLKNYVKVLELEGGHTYSRTSFLGRLSQRITHSEPRGDGYYLGASRRPVWN